MTFVFSIGIIVVTFILRSLPAVIGGRAFRNDTFDTYYHLIVARAIRENKFKVPARLERFLLPHRFSYPYLPHLLVGLLPPRSLDSFVKSFLNPLLDSVFSALLFLLALAFSGNMSISVGVALLYIFSPLMFSVQSIGPRTAHFTPRLFGEILVNLVFVLEYMWTWKGGGVFLLGAIFISSLVFTSSKFSVQALVFINAVVSVISLQFAFALVPVAGFALSVLIFGRAPVLILKSQVKHLSWYFSKNRKGEMHISKRNSLAPLLEAIRERKLKRLRSILTTDNSYFVVLFKYPVFLWTLYFMIATGSMGGFGGELVLAATIIYLLTNLRLFLFLGESERYLIHVVFFTLLIAAANLSLTARSVLIVWGCLWYVLELVYIKRKQHVDHNADVIAYLKSVPGTKRVVTFPLHLGGYRIIYQTRHSWLFTGGNIDSSLIKDVDTLYSNFPFYNLGRMPEFEHDFGIDLAIMTKSFFDEEGRRLLDPPGDWQMTTSGLETQNIVVMSRLDPGPPASPEPT